MTSLIHMERTKNNAAVRTAINRRLSPERLTVFNAVRVRKISGKIELTGVDVMYCYSDNHSMYIESKKEYAHCGWLTVSECEKMDISVFKAEEKIFSMSFSDIMNGRYNYEITPYEDVKISGVEFSKTKIAIIADVLNDRDNNYDFYISGKCLIVKNQYGIGIIKGLKRNG